VRLWTATLGGLLAGCAAIIGADFDRAPAPATADADDGGAADAGGTSVVDRSSQCPPGATECRCSSCPERPHSTAFCNPTTLACDLECDVGFDRIDDRCVGWTVDVEDLADGGTIQTLTGDQAGNVYVGGGSQGGPPFVAVRSTGGAWKSERVGGEAPVEVVTRIQDLPGQGIVATAAPWWHSPGGPHPESPLLRRAPDGTWSASPIGLPTPARDVTVMATFNELFVATGTAVRHLEGTEWKELATPCQRLFGITWKEEHESGPPGSGLHIYDDYVYCIGDGGELWRAEKNTWTWALHPFRKIDTGAKAPLNAVWGPSHKDIYAVGEAGTIVHYSGTGWTKETSDTTETLRAVWGSAADDVYAVGTAGTILHSRGDGRWTRQASGTKTVLNAVWGRGRAVTFVAGGGVVLRRD
jgi:hypothetical protein